MGRFPKNKDFAPSIMSSVHIDALVEFALNPFLGLDNSGTIPKNPVSAISDLLLVRTRELLVI